MITAGPLGSGYETANRPLRIDFKVELPRGSRINTRLLMNARHLVQLAALSLVAVIICACETMPQIQGPFPRAEAAGWWDDDDASGPAKIVVHIGEQKAYFYRGKHLVGETTVSTGKPGFSTPPGHYTVLSKDAGHVSTVFGDYVDDYGNVISSNIDSRKDSRPKGSHFDGARMPYAMFFRGGYAMHQGYVPPFAASHGCIRLPGQMAVRFFENAPVGTPVTVTE
jgi:lipoprotein-anchoring transpeptidase ErfK/SrfK